MEEGVWQEHQRRWLWIYIGLAAVFWGVAVVGALSEWKFAALDLLLVLALWRGYDWAWFLLMAAALGGAIWIGAGAVAPLDLPRALLAALCAGQLVALWSMQARGGEGVPPGRSQRRSLSIHEAKEQQ